VLSRSSTNAWHGANRQSGADFGADGSTRPELRLGGRCPAVEARPRNALVAGASQSLALLPGISRSGIAMVAGLVRGLSHEDAARFSFLLVGVSAVAVFGTMAAEPSTSLSACPSCAAQRGWSGT
jgi:Bacitracin resistance protein BacA